MSTAQQTAATVLGWLEEGRRVAAGLLVAIDGSAPLDWGRACTSTPTASSRAASPAGASRRRRPGRRWPCSRGGRPRLITYGISDELAGTVGLDVRGDGPLFVHELTDTSRDATIRGLRAFVDGEPSAVATLLDGSEAGREALRRRLVARRGLGGPRLLDVNVEREARGLVAHGRTTVRQFGEDGTTLGTAIR